MKNSRDKLYEKNTRESHANRACGGLGRDSGGWGGWVVVAVDILSMRKILNIEIDETDDETVLSQFAIRACCV